MTATPSWDGIDLELGRLARDWSTVEMLLRELFENLFALSPYSGALIHDNMSAATLIQRCRGQAGGFRDVSEVARVIDWLDRANKIRERRNDFIHGTWALIGSGSDRVTGLLVNVPRPKQGLVEQRRTTVTPSAIAAVRGEVLQLIRDFGQIPNRQGHTPGVSVLPDASTSVPPAI